ncbi:hypothetical protein QTP70_018449 [Hemibagrus guttatus]|uniref:Reverse transcriptase RNase H-like domain-containing protein n=1 Tax=Hemibagrus guttatus TaxID=175788 RepID=A0AAE0R089_9TELE|nr:hypothetical protein QTP70_018449 [Hemibagrus guttatus]
MLRGLQHTGCVLSWIPGGFVHGFSNSWTGRATVSRNTRGWRPPTSWTRPSRRTSTATTRTSLLRVRGVVHGVEPQELSLGGGLSLEEWRHWLEGAKHPFQVLTDHKNLEYIQQAKRLNPRQACWSLFFSRFQFILSYRPGSKNLKPDALSRVYVNTPQEDAITPIIPSSKIVAPIRWELEGTVKQAQAREPDPGGGPTNCVCPENGPLPDPPVGSLLTTNLSSRHITYS